MRMVMVTMIILKELTEYLDGKHLAKYFIYTFTLTSYKSPMS